MSGDQQDLQHLTAADIARYRQLVDKHIDTDGPVSEKEASRLVLALDHTLRAAQELKVDLRRCSDGNRRKLHTIDRLQRRVAQAVEHARRQQQTAEEQGIESAARSWGHVVALLEDDQQDNDE